MAPFVCINNRPECSKVPKGKQGECVKCYMRRYMRGYKQMKRQRLLKAQEAQGLSSPRRIMTRAAAKGLTEKKSKLSVSDASDTSISNSDSDYDFETPLEDKSEYVISPLPSPNTIPLTSMRVETAMRLTPSPTSLTEFLPTPRSSSPLSLPSLSQQQNTHQRTAFDCLLEEASERYDEDVSGTPHRIDIMDLVN